MKIKLFMALMAISMALFAHPGLYDVKDYGASGKKSDIVTSAIQKAIDACNKAGGGKVYFGPGDYTSGTIVLKDNVTLYLEAGATLWASKDEKDYPSSLVIYKKNDSGKEGDGATPVLIYAKNAKNIGISGKGTVNGQARRTYEDLKKVDGFIAEETEIAKKAGVEMKMYYKVLPYVCMLFLESSTNITITDAQFIEATDWTLHFKWCEDVFINNVYVQSSLEKGVNADGIDVDGCKNVVITNSIVECGDDAIVLKSTSTFNKYQSCENVTVSNCVLVSTSTALKLGTESFGDFKHIIFSNCIVRNSNRGLSIVIRDGATVDNVLFSNITIETNRKHFNWWGNGDPIWLVVKKRFPDSKIGTIKNVTFENIIARGQGTSKIEGFPSNPISNINLKNVQLTMEAESLPDKRATNILEAREVVGLDMTDVKLNWDEANGKEDKWSTAVKIENSQNVSIDKISGKPFDNEKAFIEFTNVKDAMVLRSYPLSGTKTFLKVRGNKSDHIYLKDNILYNASTAYQFTEGASEKILIKENKSIYGK